MKSLQSLSYKTLFIIFFLSLAGIVFFLKIGGKTTKVSAAWWDESWHYRKSISVTNSSGTNLTDFQVSISIGTSQLIADGKMQTDCDDIRVTDVNGNLLPYWIDPDLGCNTALDTIIYTKFNSLVSGDNTVYFYYGNNTANNIQDGASVYPQLFDTFNGTNINTDKYAYGGGGSITQNEYVSMVNNADSWDTYFYNNSLYTRNSSTVFYAKIKADTNTRSMIGWRDNSSGTGYSYLVYAIYFDNGTLRIYEDGTSKNASAGSYTVGTWYDIKIELKSTGAKYYYKNITTNTWTLLYDSDYSSESNLRPGIAHYDVSEYTHTDDWRIGKYSSSEPITSLQSEELSPAPIAYWKFDEGVGTTALNSSSIGNSLDIIIGTSSTIPTWSDGISNTALSFGINSVSQLNNYFKSLEYTGNGGITLSAWIKPNSNENDGGHIISKPWNGVGRYNYNLKYNSDRTITLQIGGSNSYSLSTTTTIPVNEWHFVSATFDSTNSVNIYIDGKLSRTGTSTVSNWTVTNDNAKLAIGCIFPYGNYCNAGSQYAFYGLIDEVKIYPYARTADQIKLDYNSRGSLSGSSANLGIQSNTAPSLKSSLIASYTFDENQGTKVYNSADTSGIDGTMHSNSSRANKDQCIKNSCVFINDTATNAFNTISAPDSDLFSNLNQITVSVWIKTITNGKANGQQIIYKRQSGGSPSWASFTLNLSSTNKPSFTIYDTNGSGSSINSSVAIEANKWYHLIGVYTGSQLKLFLNGQSVASPVNKTGTILNSNDLLMIGGLDTNYYVSGYIDDVKIYNTALTDEQVKQDYNQGSAVSFGSTTQNIGGTTTSLDYCIPGDASTCSAPVAEWKMDEGVGTSIVDTSGNSNTGTFGAGSSAPTWAQGKIGKGINFDGTNDYIQTSYTLSNTDNFTISLWAKHETQTSGGSQLRTIFSSGSPGASGGIAINSVKSDSTNATGSLQFVIYNETYLSLGFDDGKWHFITLSRNGSNILATYDGQNVLNSTITNNPTTSSITIGGSLSQAERKFHGFIDHVKIYNYARTPAQIAYDYNKGGPVGWWKLDECQGNIAYDWSGIGNTGTITIGSSGSQNSLGTCAVGTSAAWTIGATGKINSSLNFDGTDDYVNTGTTVTSKISSDYSISTWIKVPNTSGSKGIISFSQYMNLMLNSNSIKLEQAYNNLFASGYTVTAPSLISANVWYQITAIHKKDQGIWIYLNGKLVASSTTKTGTTLNVNGNTYIGAIYNLESGYYFNGQIDDVRIYNYALTSEQVKQVYNGGAVNFQ